MDYAKIKFEIAYPDKRDREALNAFVAEIIDEAIHDGNFPTILDIVLEELESFPTAKDSTFPSMENIVRDYKGRIKRTTREVLDGTLTRRLF